MEKKSRLRFVSCAVLCAASLFLGACHAPRRTVLTLSVAASLQEVLTETEAAYRQDHPTVEFRNNLGSSGTLAREIEQGAPVDAFLSAAAKPMDDVEAKGLIEQGTRRNLLFNSLVLIAPRDSQLQGFEGLAGRSVKLIALGDPASVPAGQYGQQTLAAMHLLEKVNAKLVLGKDVRQVLTYVETGNADAGIVYATDAQISDRVRVVAVAPASSHDAIVYPAAIVKASRNGQAARGFVDYLSSPAAKAVFIKHGFTIASS